MLQMIQRFQNTILRGDVNTPWYVRKSIYTRTQEVETVADVVKEA